VCVQPVSAINRSPKGQLKCTLNLSYLVSCLVLPLIEKAIVQVVTMTVGPKQFETKLNTKVIKVSRSALDLANEVRIN